jgi:hypothetical protein
VFFHPWNQIAIANFIDLNCKLKDVPQVLSSLAKAQIFFKYLSVPKLKSKGRTCNVVFGFCCHEIDKLPARPKQLRT